MSFPLVLGEEDTYIDMDGRCLWSPGHMTSIPRGQRRHKGKRGNGSRISVLKERLINLQSHPLLELMLSEIALLFVCSVAHGVYYKGYIYVIGKATSVPETLERYHQQER